MLQYLLAVPPDVWPIDLAQINTYFCTSFQKDVLKHARAFQSQISLQHERALHDTRQCDYNVYTEHQRLKGIVAFSSECRDAYKYGINVTSIVATYAGSQFTFTEYVINAANSNHLVRKTQEVTHSQENCQLFINWSKLILECKLQICLKIGTSKVMYGSFSANVESWCTNKLEVKAKPLADTLSQ